MFNKKLVAVILCSIAIACFIVYLTIRNPIMIGGEVSVVGKVIRAEEDELGHDWYVVRLNNNSAVQYLDDTFTGSDFLRFHIGDTIRVWTWDGKEYRSAVLLNVPD